MTLNAHYSTQSAFPGGTSDVGCLTIMRERD